jgi:Kef-type K+ transport system membrane component KefB
MTILYIFLVLLIVTRFFGEFSVRLKQPALVGELLAGIVVGLVVTRFSGAFPVLSGVPDNEVFTAITDLAIFFIMLLGGLEMRPRDLGRATGRALPIAIGGVVLPLLAGYLLGQYFIPDSPARFAQSMFIGVALAITAVPVTVKVLIDIGKLDTKPGQVIVAAALFDDVFSLVLLAVLTAIARTGEIPAAAELAWLGTKVLAFFAIAFVLGRFVLPRVGETLRRLQLEYIEISVLLAWALGLAVLAEALGMHFVVGAFMAGLLFTRKSVDQSTYESLTKHLEGMTVGFFAPIFFASIGMHLDVSAITEIPWVLLAVLLVAFFGKLVGAGGTARMTGLSTRESIAVGFGMNARGAVELIVADIALRAGLFSRPDPTPDVVQYLYSTIVIVAIVTTFLSPIVLRRVLSH